MIWYNGSVNYIKGLDSVMEASMLFGLLKLKYCSNSEDKSGLYFCGFKIKKLEELHGSASDDNLSTTDESNSGIVDKIVSFLKLITDENNRDAINSIKQTFFKLIKHVFPKRLEGEVEYGLDDPYLTGKVLEIFTFVYALTGDRLKVYPKWDEAIFRCKLDFSGRVIIIYTLFVICKLFLNKNFRELWRKYNGRRV